MKSNEELINAQVLAEALNLSVETIWRYTREKKIPVVELGRRQYRYKLADVISALTASTVQEKASDYKLTAEKKYTYQDYLLLPEEPGCHFEVLEGTLIKEPSPSVMHQRISRRLQRIMEDYFWEVDPEAEIFHAPLDVTFHDTTVVQPDIFYVSGEQKMIVKDTRIDGPPTLVVEVLSPSSSSRDRVQKLRIYQKAGVQHYWLVNPQDRTLECFSLREGVYALVAAGLDHDVLDHPGFEGLTIALRTLW